MKQVIIMMGAPGSGKTTYIKNNFPGAIVVSADHYFIKDGEYRFDHTQLSQAHKQCFDKFNDHISKYAVIIGDAPIIVVDNTNTRLKELRPYIDLAKDYGYNVKIIAIKCDVNLASSRNVHGVPHETIVKMATGVENTLRLLPSTSMIYDLTLIEYKKE